MLKIENASHYTFDSKDLFIDVLGGINTQELHQLIVTLRLKNKHGVYYRTTLDLYIKNQVDKLLRSICDALQLKLIEVCEIINQLILDLETHRLKTCKSVAKNETKSFDISDNERKKAIDHLKSKQLTSYYISQLQRIGLIACESHLLLLLIAIASSKSKHPISILNTLSKPHQDSLALDRLANCLDASNYSYHSQLSSKALYYFKKQQLHQKVMLVEDLDFNKDMRDTLSLLQQRNKLVKTRIVKQSDGQLKAVNFELESRLCIIANTTTSNQQLHNCNLPFLFLNDNESTSSSEIKYQQQLKTGLINEEKTAQSQQALKSMLSILKPLKVINPYAMQIQLPKAYLNKSTNFILLLDLIEAISFLFQYQRKKYSCKQTAEMYIKTTKDDISLALKLLLPILSNQSEGLSQATKSFLKCLQNHLNKLGVNQFRVIDIRPHYLVHPRTLNRYLQELKLFGYIEIIGGNKYRQGYIYELKELKIKEPLSLKTNIESILQNLVLDSKTVSDLDAESKTSSIAKTEKIQ